MGRLALISVCAFTVAALVGACTEDRPAPSMCGPARSPNDDVYLAARTRCPLDFRLPVTGPLASGSSWWRDENVEGTMAVVGATLEIRYQRGGVDQLVVYDIQPNNEYPLNADAPSLCLTDSGG